MSNFFHAFTRFGWLIVRYPFHCVLSRLPFLLEGLFLRLTFIACLGEEDLFSINNIRGICCNLNSPYLEVLPDFRSIFSVTLSIHLERKSAAVLIDPAVWAILKLLCNTYSHAFHSAGGIAFVWKNCVTDLLPIRTIVRFIASHKRRAISRNALQIAKISFE